ncbi:class I SAM-dependent methyltransferase [Paenibacillus sepulcri]|uniref:Methyltransferase domain-containing protein n=1 Tax=Paenibacillus sepulcri TaxID=359917 RepID=A0ABS7BXU2_9BACL|nr:methyltransferase domain-containing protein [Paenibacillus sepulcri]
MKNSEKERNWQNWDKSDNAKIIDNYWLATEMEKNWRKTVVQHIQEILDSPSKITEIGCGTGLIANELMTTGVVNKNQYQGGDISENMLEIARSRLPDISFYKWDIFNLALANKSQPNLICIHVLQHLPEIITPIKELVRVARDRLYIACWFSDTNETEIRFNNLEEGFYNNIYSLPDFLNHVHSAASIHNRKISDINVQMFDSPICAVTITFKD